MTENQTIAAKPKTHLAHALYGILMLCWIVAGVAWVMSVERDTVSLLLIPKVCIVIGIVVVVAIGFLLRDSD